MRQLGFRFLSIAIFISCVTLGSAQVYGEPFEVVDFAGGIPAGWENTTDTGISAWEYRGPGTMPDNNTGSLGSCMDPSLVIASESHANGFVIFDSNYWDDPNGPCGSGFGSGLDPAPHTATLTSSSFNFSDKDNVVLNFQQRFRYHIVTTAAVQLSINGGAFFTIHNNPTTTGSQTAAVQYVNVNISQWAAFQSDVRVRFHYQGIYYYWMIDDIVFYSPNDNDLLLEDALYTDFDFSSGETGLEDLEYHSYVRFMLPTHNFHATVRNVGGLTQTNCYVQALIKNQNNTTVHTSQSGTFTLNPTGVTEVSWGEYPTTSIVAQYTVTFTVFQSQTDQELTNNVIVKDFEITQWRYGVAEKNMEGTYTPANQFLNNPFEIGCVYEVTTDFRKLNSIGVVLSDSTQVGDQFYGIVYNLNRDTIYAITDTLIVNPYWLNSIGEEKVAYLQLNPPLNLINGEFYNVMIGSVGSGEKIRVGTHGDPPPFSCFIKYPGTPFTYYLTKTPMVYMHIFGQAANPGCIDPLASNFNPSAAITDGSCLYPGCTFPEASNYNPSSNFDNGSCQISGCTNPEAANYNPVATFDDGSCVAGGCTNPGADNYDPLATIDDGSCIISGCTDASASNYNQEANSDDGSCIYLGCTDQEAANYDPQANEDNGTCVYPGCTNPLADNFDSSANQDNGSCILSGCTDPDAINFSAEANNDDGSCIYPGCTDPIAANYDAQANEDDGSCIYPGCTNPVADNYNPGANQEDGSCIISGCTDADASNFSAEANNDDGSCIYPGCTDPAAANYDPQANEDNDTCVYPGCTNPLADNYNPMANQEDGSCIISGCTDPEANNFSAGANNDDGSCIYPGCTDPQADNYDPQANEEDGSCIYFGCTDPEALNFDPGANMNDMSCLYPFAMVSTDQTAGCAPLTLTVFNQTQVGTGGICSFDLGDGNEVSNCDGTFIHTYTEPGEYYIHYTYTVSGSETDSIYGPITIFPVPDNISLSFDPVTQTLSCTGCQGMALEWVLNDEPLGVLTTSFVAVLSGSYGLSVVNEFGCVGGAQNLSIQVQTTAALQVTNTAGCAPLTVTISPANDLNPDAVCYFDMGDGIEVQGCEIFEYEYTTEGSYTITYHYEVGEWNSSAVAGPIDVYPVPELPALNFDNQTNQLWCTGCEGLALTWTFEDATLPDTDTLITAISTGTYSLIVENEFGCTSFSEIFAEVTSIAEFGPNHKWQLIPNPAHREVTISGGEYVHHWEVTDSRGRTVLTSNTTANNDRTQDVSALESGIYFVKILDGKSTHFLRLAVSH